MPLLVELFSGTGTVSRVFRGHGWDTLTVDADPACGADVESRIEDFQYHGPTPDLVWASPPCTTFSLAHYMRGAEPTGADWPLVQLTRRTILAMRPRYWVIENVRGLVRWWPNPAASIGPWFFWGHFPPLPARGPFFKLTDQVRAPARRGAIPAALAETFHQAIRQQPELTEWPRP